MNTFNFAHCEIIELDYNDMLSIEGGGFFDAIMEAAEAVGKAVGYGVGYAAGAIKDAITSHGADVADSGGAAAVLAYK